ncbi:MAG: hypothetical protein ACSLE6_06975 [Mycobacterium sp.]
MSAPREPFEPLNIEKYLAEPQTYEETILRIFSKKSVRGSAFSEAADKVTYFAAASDRKTLAKAIARSVAAGIYRPQPVDLWFLEAGGKRRMAHMPAFVDHVVGAALFQLMSHNARCYGLPGVYSYLPGMTNLGAMRTFARFVREHRKQTAPLYVLQSDFAAYGDSLPVGPGAALWPILYDVANLGCPSGEISSSTWDLITALVRPIVRDDDGAQFTRLNGIAMGTPLVPVLGNLAVVPMDKAITAIDGVFYARYNDDFIIAHPDLDALHEADTKVDALVERLGVTRKLTKEVRTALSANGQPAAADPAYRGRDRIDCLGLTVTHTGTVSVGPHRLRRFVQRITTRLDASAPALMSLPAKERARHLVATTNVMLDASSPFAVAGLAALLEATTDRGTLKDIDARIARKIVQVATGVLGVRGFRQVPPEVLRGELGLVSLVHLRNVL